jgi:preprotein translocase subunit SecG
MTTLLLILHVIVCISLIAIVLIQGGKGADIGAAFGAGASQTVFGATGRQSFLGKLTAGAAIIFMLTSLLLAYFYATPGFHTIMPNEVRKSAQSQSAEPQKAEKAPAAPVAPGPETQSKDAAK